MSFHSMGLSEPVLRAISEKGYKTPSPIQEKVIPIVLENKDVIAAAQTGTGKTAGFTLPILEKLGNSGVNQATLRVLVLTPTRELAAQVSENVEAYSKYLKLRSEVIFGGVNANPQIKSLRRGVDILIATPGRLLDLHNQGVFSFKKIEILVLDEADRMLDMGFQRDINKLLKLLPSKRQNLLFSATFSSEIKKLAGSFMHKPVFVEATPENTTVEKINQQVYRVDKKRKTELILDLIAGGKWEQVLVFTRTKHGANRLAEKMNKADIQAAAIHGNKSQGARTKALQGFKAGTVRVLVATDIAARGLDIPLLPHVINYELPNVPEDYVHRIGRTGRAGASGMALSLVSLDEVEYLRDIERLIKTSIPKMELEGFDLTEKASDLPASPKKKNFNRSRQKRNNYKRHK